MRSRLVYIDVIKIFAIVFVLMCHVPIIYNIEATQENMSIGWLSSYIFGTMGVPLFMMCTGALVLKKRFESLKDITRFYKKNLLTIYVTGVLWCLIYLFIAVLRGTETLSLTVIVKTILLINKPEVHLWYIRMILLYYLAIPCITYLLEKHKKIFGAIVLFIFIITFVKNTYEILVCHNACPTTSGLSLSCYLIYLVIGYYFSDVHKFDGKNSLVHKSLWLLVFFGGIVSAILFRHLGYYRFMWYDNPFVFISSVGLFTLLKATFEDVAKLNRVVSEMSKMTFGVYLCHMVVLLYVMPDLIHYLDLSIEFEWMIVMVVVLMMSFVFVHLCHYIPILSKVLFRY